jgi:hypothetical protein
VSSAARACPACGLLVSPEARFCSQCGLELVGGGARPHAFPIRRFGVLAAGPILVLACVLLVLGIVLLIAGSPVVAIILLALSVAAFVLFYGTIERNPADPVAHRTLTSGRRVRGWSAFAWRSLRAWLRATREITRATTESRSLRRERTRLLSALGDAAYREDARDMETLRIRLHEIDDSLLAKQRARVASLARARRHVHDERVAVQPTQRFQVRDLTSESEGDR